MTTSTTGCDPSLIAAPRVAQLGTRRGRSFLGNFTCSPETAGATTEASPDAPTLDAGVTIDDAGITVNGAGGD